MPGMVTSLAPARPNRCHISQTSFSKLKEKSRHLGRHYKLVPLGLGETSALTYDELVAINRTEFGHMVIPNIEDLSDDASASQACSQVAISPTCPRVLYELLGQESLGLTRIGVISSPENLSNQTDVETFFQRFRPDAVGAGSET